MTTIISVNLSHLSNSIINNCEPNFVKKLIYNTHTYHMLFYNTVFEYQILWESHSVQNIVLHGLYKPGNPGNWVSNLLLPGYIPSNTELLFYVVFLCMDLNFLFWILIYRYFFYKKIYDITCQNSTSITGSLKYTQHDHAQFCQTWYQA